MNKSLKEKEINPWPKDDINTLIRPCGRNFISSPQCRIEELSPRMSFFRRVRSSPWWTVCPEVGSVMCLGLEQGQSKQGGREAGVPPLKSMETSHTEQPKPQCQPRPDLHSVTCRHCPLSFSAKPHTWCVLFTGALAPPGKGPLHSIAEFGEV